LIWSRERVSDGEEGASLDEGEEKA
jgi:hypothetical protein